MNNLMNIEMIPDKSEGSLKKGIWFVFEHDGNKIGIWGSSLNGKEIVYLNDQIISEKRNLKFKGNHQFKDNNGNEFNVLFTTTNVIKGELKCEVLKNGVRIKTFTAKYIKSKYFDLKYFIIFIVFAMLFGVFMGILKVSEEIFFTILLAIITIFLILKIGKNTGTGKNVNFLIDEIDN